MLALVGIVATLWLALTDRLGLYIHPRYFWFTVVMAVIGAVLAVAAFAVAPLDDEHDEHDVHDESDLAAPASSRHGHADATRAAPERTRAVLAVAIVVTAAVALLVLPPATLTSATATQRSLNSGGSAGADPSVPTLVGADTSEFTVRDWALLLRQNPDPAQYADADVDVTGFVLASPDDPENVFYVARFVVTCCAVDAQPVGVPVYLPGWQEEYDVDQWVEASGALAANLTESDEETLVLVPEQLTVVEEPSQPYVY